MTMKLASGEIRRNEKFQEQTVTIDKVEERKQLNTITKHSNEDAGLNKLDQILEDKYLQRMPVTTKHEDGVGV